MYLLRGVVPSSGQGHGQVRLIINNSKGPAASIFLSREDMVGQVIFMIDDLAGKFQTFECSELPIDDTKTVVVIFIWPRIGRVRALYMKSNQDTHISFLRKSHVSGSDAQEHGLIG